MKDIRGKNLWFVVGSQHLYGEDTLKQVADHAKTIVEGLNKGGKINNQIIYKLFLLHLTRSTGQL